MSKEGEYTYFGFNLVLFCCSLFFFLFLLLFVQIFLYLCALFSMLYLSLSLFFNRARVSWRAGSSLREVAEGNPLTSYTHYLLYNLITIFHLACLVSLSSILYPSLFFLHLVWTVLYPMPHCMVSKSVKQAAQYQSDRQQ